MADSADGARCGADRLRVRRGTLWRGGVLALHRDPDVRRHAALARGHRHRAARRLSCAMARPRRIRRHPLHRPVVLGAARCSGRRVHADRMAARLCLHGLPVACTRVHAGARRFRAGVCAARRRIPGDARHGTDRRLCCPCRGRTGSRCAPGDRLATGCHRSARVGRRRAVANRMDVAGRRATPRLARPGQRAAGRQVRPAIPHGDVRALPSTRRARATAGSSCCRKAHFRCSPTKCRTPCCCR